jgi:hypothetical protein
MMYVTAPSLRDELLDQLRCPFGERGAHDDPVQAGCLSGTKARSVGVIRETEDRDVGVGFGHFVGVNPGEIDDYEVGWIDAVGGDKAMRPEEHVKLASEKDIDPDQQDRRHEREPNTENVRKTGSGRRLG